jgi:hypothetical protein
VNLSIDVAHDTKKPLLVLPTDYWVDVSTLLGDHSPSMTITFPMFVLLLDHLCPATAKNRLAYLVASVLNLWITPEFHEIIKAVHNSTVLKYLNLQLMCLFCFKMINQNVIAIYSLNDQSI